MYRYQMPRSDLRLFLMILVASFFVATVSAALNGRLMDSLLFAAVTIIALISLIIFSRQRLLKFLKGQSAMDFAEFNVKFFESEPFRSGRIRGISYVVLFEGRQVFHVRITDRLLGFLKLSHELSGGKWVVGETLFYRRNDLDDSVPEPPEGTRWFETDPLHDPGLLQLKPSGN